MIIKANTELGSQVRVYGADNNPVQMPIFSFNTETKIAEVYKKDSNGQITMELDTVILDGSYAKTEDGVVL